jgi:hypothetical protein
VAVKAGWINLLEDGTVTVTGSATDYPSYRLYDRLLGPDWKAATTTTQTIHVDQGGSPVAINTLAIPTGHNLNGLTCDWQWSENDVDWTNAVPQWVQSGTGIIIKTASTSLTKRYWRMVVTSPGIAIEIGELFMTLFYEFTAQPSYDGSGIGYERNVVRSESIGGIAAYLRQGEPRRALTYRIGVIAGTELSTFQSWDNAWDGCKPFLFQDHLGNQFFAEFDGKVVFTPIRASGYYSVDLKILEVL